MWTLILVMSLKSAAGVTSLSTEYSSKENCEQAYEQFVKANEYTVIRSYKDTVYTNIVHVCSPK